MAFTTVVSLTLAQKTSSIAESYARKLTYIQYIGCIATIRAYLIPPAAYKYSKASGYFTKLTTPKILWMLRSYSVSYTPYPTLLLCFSLSFVFFVFYTPMSDWLCIFGKIASNIGWTNSTYIPTVPQRHRQTDRRTTYDSNVLCVSVLLHIYLFSFSWLQVCLNKFSSVQYTRHHDTAVVSSLRLLYPELLCISYLRYLHFL